MKLYVFDVDGTLVGSSGRMKKAVINAINKKLANGDAVAIASGRPFLGIKKYLDKFIDGRKFAIAANGGATYTYDGEVLDTCALKYSDFLDMYKKFEWLIDKRSASIYCYTLNTVGYFKMTPNTKYESICNGHIRLQNFNRYPGKSEEPILKIMIACDAEKLKDVDFSVEMKKFNEVDSSNYYHEYINKQTDKARGVEALRKLLKINKEECYCFGDEMNDYLMIKNYIGIAMGNSNSRIIEVAKYKTKSVKDNGVAYALEEYFK